MIGYFIGVVILVMITSFFYKELDALNRANPYTVFLVGFGIMFWPMTIPVYLAMVIGYFLRKKVVDGKSKSRHE